MYLTKQEKKDLIVKPAKHGQGVFARKNFKIGQKIVQIIGQLITCDEDADVDEETRSNTFRFDADWYLSPKGRVGNYFNHSCRPNAKVVKKNNKLFILSIEPILKGEEIVFDYSTIIAADDIWEMNCECGDENCRGVVKQFKKLPKKVREKYLSLDMVPKHILD